jgi:hypothetical protein
MSELARKLIRAYHGSPHSFDRFDASKIGSGEGAQAYGHGLYFAGNEDIARYYRDKLSPAGEPNVEVGGKPVEGGGQLGFEAVFGYPQADGAPFLAADPWAGIPTRDKAIRFLKMGAFGGDDIPTERAFDTARGLIWSPEINGGNPAPEYEQSLLRELDRLQAEGAQLAWPQSGHMYEVALDTDPDQLIKGDLPVKWQTPQVQEALKELGYRTSNGRGERGGLQAYNNVVTKAENKFATEGAMPRDIAAASRMAKDSVTRDMVDMGINGIQYLDNTSRRKGYGSSNYVMFPGTEEMIRIIRKYGFVPPALAAAGAAGQAQAGSDLDAAMKGMRQANATGRAAAANGANPREANAAALASFVPESTRSGQPLSQYLGSLSEQDAAMTPRGMYATAVQDSMTAPVISVSAAAQVLGDESVSDRYQGGYLSPMDFAREQSLQESRALFEQRKAAGPFPPGAEEAFVQWSQQQADRRADSVAGVLAGTYATRNPAINQTAGQLRQLVAMHTPNQEFAQFGGRTAAEDKQARQQYGSDAEWRLTEGGQKNYDAQRVAELWSATQDDYTPASTMSQVARAVGGGVTKAYDAMVPGSIPKAGQAWKEMGMINQPDGKYEYAARLYDRGAQHPGNVYTAEGLPKYGTVDPTTAAGLGNATALNQSFPLAAWYQQVGAPIREVANWMGNDREYGDPNMVRNLRELRAGFNRVTPVVPDGVDPQAFQTMGQKLSGADQRLSGWTSAYGGPAFADAYNATLGKVTGQMDRTYLSPFAQTMAEIPAEIVGDPVNAAFNVVLPVASGIKGAITGGIAGGARQAAMQGGGSLIRKLASAPKRSLDDIIEENVEGLGFGSAVAGIQSYFSPEKKNLLMGEADPNDPGYDKKLEEASVQARTEQMDAAREYGDAVGRKSPKPTLKTPMPQTFMLTR